MKCHKCFDQCSIRNSLYFTYMCQSFSEGLGETSQEFALVVTLWYPHSWCKPQLVTVTVPPIGLPVTSEFLLRSVKVPQLPLKRVPINFSPKPPTQNKSPSQSLQKIYLGIAIPNWSGLGFPACPWVETPSFGLAAEIHGPTSQRG